MPITYKIANNGTRYPVYSGDSVLHNERQFLLNHSGSYGLTRHQMYLTLNGHPNAPVSGMAAVQRQTWLAHNPPRPLVDWHDLKSWGSLLVLFCLLALFVAGVASLCRKWFQ
jgi:hypothetical protein